MSDIPPPAGFAVRPARREDVPALHGLIHELAVYEREPDAVEATEADLEKALFADQPLVHGFVAELTDGPDAGRVVGMALWFVTYSTWRGRHGIWLEDLFVSPSARGLGIGRALLAELAAETVARGYARLEWNVLDWNSPALGFYAALGAEPLAEWTVHRIADEPLRALAARAATREARYEED